MELNVNFEIRFPEALAKAFGFTDETAFETYYSDGALHIVPLTDLDEPSDLRCPVTDAVCEGDCALCAVLDAACTGECLGCDFRAICGEGRK